MKAFGTALLAALLSLSSALLLASSIKSVDSGIPPLPSWPSFERVASPELVNHGRRLYGMSCAECHGDDATGDEGPDLHNLPISNARIVVMIKKGIKGEMPTFAKKYKDDQIAALVTYLRSLPPE